MTKSLSHAAGKRGILAVLSLCSALALSAPAHAQYEVFDPWTYEEQALTYAQAVQQVSQATQQLTQLENQLQTQENMVQSLGSDFSSPQLASVNASNTASGQTGALQATNQLLAAVSGQLAQLQDVLITMSQAQTTLAAQKLQDAPVVQSVTNTYQQQTSQSLTAAPGVTNTNSL